MEILVANLKGRPRRATKGGRQYLVVPVSMIVPGVLNGSRGPGYYPLDQLSQSCSLWEGMPVTVNHPFVNGKGVSVNHEGILEAQGIGFVTQPKVNGKLSAEAWIDVVKAKQVDNRIIKNLDKEQPIELSTGLGVEPLEAPPGSRYKGVPYDFIATNLKPDHLAFLPDEVGACSIADGCGVLINRRGDTMPTSFTALEDLVNELSHEETRRSVESALQAKFKQSDPTAWIAKMYDDFAIYEQGGKLYRVEYRIDPKQKVTLGKPVQVMKEVTFVATNRKENTMPMTAEEKAALVGGIIQNCECWTENDQQTLLSFDDEKIRTMAKHVVDSTRNAAVANAAKKGFTDPGGNTHVYNEQTGKWEAKEAATLPPVVSDPPVVNTTQQLTREQWLAAAPADLVQDYRDAETVKNQRKKAVVDKLVANVADDQKEAQAKRLMGRPLTDLEADLALVGNAATATDSQAGDTQEDKQLLEALNALGGGQEEDVLIPNSHTQNSDASTQPSLEELAGQEWMKNVPDAFRRLVGNAMRKESEEKATLIDQLVANVSQDQKLRLRQRLSGMTPEEVRDIAVLRGGKPQQPTTNFSGQAAPPPVTINTQGAADDDLLPLPTMRREKKPA